MKNALEEKMKETVNSMIVTRGFFIMLHEGGKIGMSTLVKQYDSREDQELYKDEAHSSLVDAVLLSTLRSVATGSKRSRAG